ncbi:hypothetical protein KAH27_07150, partial [bacterium]|nr:hypothetical protein [bacterium]
MKSFLIIIIFAAFNVCAQLTLPSIFSDNMVLQRDMKIPVWGKSAPEEQVGVWFHGQKRITTADKEGNWKVYLSPISVDNNPRKMMIKSGNSKIILTNVVLGDVWLCSGQSNMKFELKHAAGAKKFIAEAKESGIRFYQADRYNFKPYECDNCSGEWKVCATNNVRNLTAVGYLFGMEIHKKIGVPIGLIEVDFGGSIVESWMSAAVLQKWDYFKKDLAKLAKYKNPKSFDFLKKKETK